jgi:flavin-dependent dehydrogenase
VIERARIVVGADGRNSRLAKFVRAPMYECHDALTCWYFSYWHGVEARGLEVYFRGPRVIFAFPTSDGLLGIFVGWRRDELPRVRSDIEREFMTVVDLVPDFSARLRAGIRAERFLGATDVPNFLRRPHGAGWALVGDAGCHKDPLLALGICDAFRDAEGLADAIDGGLSGRCPLDAALVAYWRERDAATLGDYRRNLNAAMLAPPPAEELRMRADVRGDDSATRQYFWARQASRPE